VLWNTGRKQQEFLLQLPLLALAGPAWWLFAPSGIRGVAIVSAIVVFIRALVIVAAALNALQLRWLTIVAVRSARLGLSAVAAAAVLAGQHAVATLTFPGVALYAGGICAMAAMLLLILVRPQVLGLRHAAPSPGLFRASGWAIPVGRHDETHRRFPPQGSFPAMLAVVALSTLLSGRDLSQSFLDLTERASLPAPGHSLGAASRLAHLAGRLRRTDLQPFRFAQAHAFARAHRRVHDVLVVQRGWHRHSSARTRASSTSIFTR
jgi:hypothetical protein